MQEDNLQVEYTQERILISLLESSKTTAELANELGYVNQEGNARYNMIYRALKQLKKDGYIEGYKVKLGKNGNDPTLYSTDSSIQNLIHILEKYPDLISKIQKNNSIRENIFREHLDLIYGSKDMEFLNRRFGTCEYKDLSSTSTRTYTFGSQSTYDSSKKDGAEHAEVTLF
jgi:DNA-binding PadR family transcriptional regulator